MTEEGIDMKLDNGIDIFGKYCQRSNLPLVPMSQVKREFSFWIEAFTFTVDNLCQINSILGDNNTNLSASQKELLLWHQRLSHASIGWVQSLIRKKQWLTSEGNKSMHSGPFIVTKNNAPTCDVSNLKCAACLCAKATIKTPTSRNPRQSIKQGLLKTDNLTPGACILADHYFSPVQGRLPHMYGREKYCYTCRSLSVDHISGKIFNFPQFSTNNRCSCNEL
jgi:hypothetical protein